MKSMLDKMMHLQSDTYLIFCAYKKILQSQECPNLCSRRTEGTTIKILQTHSHCQSTRFDSWCGRQQKNCQPPSFLYGNLSLKQTQNISLPALACILQGKCLATKDITMGPHDRHMPCVLQIRILHALTLQRFKQCIPWRFLLRLVMILILGWWGFYLPKVCSQHWVLCSPNKVTGRATLASAWPDLHSGKGHAG